MSCRILRFPHIRRHTKSIHRVSHSGNIWYRLPANHRQYPGSRRKVLNFYIILEIVCIYDAGYCYPPISGHTPKHTLNISKRKYMIQTPDERSVTNTSEIYVHPTDTTLWLYIVDVVRWRSFETPSIPHICVSKLTIIGSYTGLSPGRRRVIIWTNAGILLIRTLGTNLSEILSEIHTFSLKQMHLKMSSSN